MLLNTCQRAGFRGKAQGLADQSGATQRHRDFVAQASVTLLINSAFLFCLLWSFQEENDHSKSERSKLWEIIKCAWKQS